MDLMSSFVFVLGVPAFAEEVDVMENPMTAAPTHPADAISGELTADANVQVFSSNGANKRYIA